MTARDVARRVLDRVDRGGAWATLTLDAELARSGLDERDRRLASELVYGVLRHRARIDRAIAAHAKIGKTHPRVLTALRVAVYQLLFLRVPDYAAVDALTQMRDWIYTDGIVPAAVLTWQEEQVRLAFQNGQAVFMRNWPYAYSLLQDPAQSRVAGRFGVAPIPAANSGSPTAALGGSALAINANSGDPGAAYALIEYLLEPAQLLERAQLVGEYPPRPTMYATGKLGDALQINPSEARRIIEDAVPRPVTPVYSELSEILQIALHRALTRQQEPRVALRDAAAAMRKLLERFELDATPR